MSSSVFSFSLDVRLPAVEVEPGPDQREQTRRVHVADDLQGVLGPVGQLVHVDEQRVHLTRRARVVPAEERVVPARLLLHLRVDARQRIVEQLVVIAELQELGIGELDNLERRLRAGGSIVHERRVPRRNHEVVGEIRDPVPQNLVALLAAQRARARREAPRR